MNEEQARLEQRASDLMNLNAIALEETEQSLHASADRRNDEKASARLHELADGVSETAAQIAARAQRLSPPA
ncbi:hypothetical protein [Winogradskya humida]|uniref:Methyl-accepting chemotaxis protein n=1 Tax=Winogradskya humida TaxID=113566 RepID=A0ABQ3ZZ70_9ACTN|nr:hypothetical protein [Actinoplanes humidus]GIE23868.1 hypothetical protein Ahu01nite_069700 [Actinoplanes humidus]